MTQLEFRFHLTNPKLDKQNPQIWKWRIPTLTVWEESYHYQLVNLKQQTIEGQIYKKTYVKSYGFSEIITKTFCNKDKKKSQYVEILGKRNYFVYTKNGNDGTFNYYLCTHIIIICSTGFTVNLVFIIFSYVFMLTIENHCHIIQNIRRIVYEGNVYSLVVRFRFSWLGAIWLV